MDNSGPVSDHAEFDAVSRRYDSLVNEALAFSGLKVDYFTSVKAGYLRDIARGHFGAIDRLDAIDIGCGIGNYHPLLVPGFRRLAGVDVSRASIEAARERNRDIDYAVFDGFSIPHDDASFDIAFAVCVFHHVPPANRAALVREAGRLLRSNGLFVIFEHNPFNPLTMRVVNRCEFDKDAILLTGSETRNLLSANGFSNVRTNYILTIPSFNKFTRSLDRLLGRIPVGAQYFTCGRID